jgi:hypothetical protein
MDNRYELSTKLQHLYPNSSGKITGELFDEVKQWLDDNEISYLYSFNVYMGGTLYFPSKEHIMMFKMVWG